MAAAASRAPTSPSAVLSRAEANAPVVDRRGGVNRWVVARVEGSPLAGRQHEAMAVGASGNREEDKGTGHDGREEHCRRADASMEKRHGQTQRGADPSGWRPQAVCVEGQAAPPASPIESVSNARGELDASCRRAALDGEKLCEVVDPALRTSDPRRRSDMGNAGRPTAAPARRLWPWAHASCFPCVALVVVPRLASLTAKRVALRCHDARREENRVASRAVHARGWVPLDAHRYN